MEYSKCRALKSILVSTVDSVELKSKAFLAVDSGAWSGALAGSRLQGLGNKQTIDMFNRNGYNRKIVSTYEPKECSLIHLGLY
eukprot:906027-Prorocentrum_minimum.AAC.1